MKTNPKGPSSNPEVRDLRNEDPITGEAGAHPVGAGLGAAAGGAAAGAAAGAVGGPVGAAVGAVVGGIAGAYAGKAIAENVDPTVEAAYWRDTYPSRPYYDEDVTYEDLEPAYQSGWEIDLSDDIGERWEDRESQAHSQWETRVRERGQPLGMTWDQAKIASQDAYNRILERKRQCSLNKPR